MQRLYPVFEFIGARYREPVRVLDAASLVHMSESRFMQFFKEATAQSFVSYLNGVRISKAQNLLASTNKSIVEVSHETGFCDQSYFGLVFRKRTRMSPLEYRRKIQAHTSVPSR
jgi:two-component system response regulator YesN